MKQKKIKQRNPFAYMLTNDLFHQRVVKSKKKYKRNEKQKIIKKALNEINQCLFFIVFDYHPIINL
ncbi:MAG: hypothetical protein BWY78_01470 [Alphaproteobacteria bacterium ADurb.Bin438]|nr:MAG: hypothetical protein BWY78_01470 [Alphaproteobacteria bacterium ADurb.Bin438]